MDCAGMAPLSIPSGARFVSARYGAASVKVNPRAIQSWSTRTDSKNRLTGKKLLSGLEILRHSCGSRSCNSGRNSSRLSDFHGRGSDKAGGCQ